MKSTPTPQTTGKEKITLMLAEFDIETRYKARVERGRGKAEQDWNC